VRQQFALISVASLALLACSINDDVRQFRETVPERISGLAWLDLVPLGRFGNLAPIEPAPNVGSMVAQAAALRFKAAELRARTVLEPKRARQMRAALARANQ
jgi:hypothetical protein